MKLTNDSADVFIPDGTERGAALARTTHLGIGAHQDVGNAGDCAVAPGFVDVG